MSESSSNRYAAVKWSTFVSMYVGYTLIVLNRKSFSFALPAIMSEGKLQKGDLGLIASSQNLAYTGSKFLGGLLADRVSSRVLFSVGMILSGLITVAFTGFESASMFAMLWFLQGAVQGGAWPACAKILRQWCDETEFGTMWSVISTSMNFACMAGPLLVAFIITYTGSWRASLFISGTLAVATGFICFLTITNSPAEIGLDGASGGSNDKTYSAPTSGGKGRGSWPDMLSSPFMWVLCTSYGVLYIGRTAALDWAQLLLIEEKGQSEYMGSIFVSSLEMGGIIGSIVAGYAADKLVAISNRSDTRGTPRMTVAIGYMILYLFSLHAMIFSISEESSQLWTSAVGFVQGFAIYGPVSLYGVMAIEAAPTHLSGTSHAIVALSANVGAILAGLPFSYIAHLFEWKGAFIVLEVLLIGVIILKIATRNLEYKMVTIRKKMD